MLFYLVFDAEDEESVDSVRVGIWLSEEYDGIGFCGSFMWIIIRIRTSSHSILKSLKNFGYTLLFSCFIQISG